MTNSTNLGLPYLAEGQAQKHVTLNQSLQRLDATTQIAVESATTASEPPSPADGQTYLVPTGKTGTNWATFTDWALAYYRDGAWEQITPREGWRAWVRDGGHTAVYNGANWVAEAHDANRNRLINPSFAINQRRVASNADDTYCFDRWYALTQSGAVAASGLSDPESGRPTGIRLTQSHGSAQRIGIAQIVEAANIKDLRAKAAAMTARVRCSASQPIRMAILEWTGTADGVTSDVVDDWTDATFGAGNFFLGSNLNVIATGATTPDAGTWTDLDAISGAFGASLNNAIVMIWTEGTLANGETLDLDGVQLEGGAFCAPFSVRLRAEELEACQRYFELAPGFGAVLGLGPMAQKIGAVLDAPVAFRTVKRIAPAIYHSSPSYAAGNPSTNNEVAFYNNNAGGWATVTGALSIATGPATETGGMLRLQAATAISGTTGDTGFFYWGGGAVIGFDAEL